MPAQVICLADARARRDEQRALRVSAQMPAMFVKFWAVGWMLPGYAYAMGMASAYDLVAQTVVFGRDP